MTDVRGAPVRALVFEDSVYGSVDGQLSTDRAFLHFVSRLVDEGLSLTLLGRLSPVPARSYYAVPECVAFVGLPSYPSLVHWSVPFALARSLRRAWVALGKVDVVWLMGPHPLSLALTLLARARGVPVVLGVRQDLPEYARGRHPGRRWVHRIADLLELLWRRAATTSAVVAVGPQLVRSYSRSARLLRLDISLVREQESGGQQAPLPDAGELRLLSVGRLEQEKNPLLLADVLALLLEDDPRWRLVVAGEGSLEGPLRARLAELGLTDQAELCGYVPVDRGLLELYRTSHTFLHVSLTEGMPQVLYEAWSVGLPVVATAVGGVTEAARGAALLVPPADAVAASQAVRMVMADAPLRERLVAAGSRRVEGVSMDQQLSRLAAFLTAAAARTAS
jgi:glycosyltransferase involved in cell wall biosynthesis